MGGAIEYLDPAIANEGVHVDHWKPGAWADAPADAGEEWQPDIEPPHINDYAAMKKHKHYRQYFRPYRYQPFPAFMYHATLDPKIVKTKEEVIALGPEWSPKPLKPRVDMTGKSLPVKTETQKLAETIATAMAVNQKGAAVDPNSIAAIVAAVMAAMNPQRVERAAAEASPEAYPDAGDDSVERTALFELAEKERIRIDKRWSTARIKEALGL